MRYVAFVLACLLLTSCKPGIAYRMPTEGMLPTIGTNDLCTANPMAYSVGEVKRFDLVVFRPNQEQRDKFRDEGLLYLMRVVGMPKEKLEIKDNVVYINDKFLEEPYPKFLDGLDKKKDFGPVTIPENEYFFLGDNRPNSEDSRFWAKPTIHRDSVVSKIVSIEKDFYKGQ
ncbi:MAG: signal peptidase I [Pyrinomonadaceae bacterium]